ncbi:hypothetical protein LZ554_008638 [Drepanopeziza brunnea f. sp. 'monogermtubi']|nr:hypothetical protein LZ554_008638 [Drepanopeziza brunnea f. sp. 'monogermtubi']
MVPIKDLEYTYVVIGPFADIGGYLGMHPHAPGIGCFNVKEKKAVVIGDGKDWGRWDISYGSLEEVRELEKEAYDSKNPAATIFTLKRIWGSGGALYEKRDNGLVDAEDMETLEDVIKATIASQLSANS